MATRRVYYMVGLNDAETWGILEIGQEPILAFGMEVMYTIATYRGPFDTREEAIEREHAIWHDLEAELVLVVRADGVGYLPSSRYPGTHSGVTQVMQQALDHMGRMESLAKRSGFTVQQIAHGSLALYEAELTGRGYLG